MSKIKVLVTVLLLGTSSVALAQPTMSWSPRGWRMESDLERIDAARRYRSSWVSLAEPLQLSRGRDVIDVNQQGTFTQLRVQTVAGASFIDRVVVRFRDGSRQIVDVRRAVSPHHRMIELLLDGNNRRIASIAVVGRSQPDAAIQIFGI